MKPTATGALPFALIALAGWVDALGYLQLQHLFVSFMSGNSTQLGVGLGQGDWHAAWPAGVLIALFVLGAFAGTLVAASTGRWRLPAVLGIEGILLGLALVLPGSVGGLLVAAFPMALAMGLQNAAAYSDSRMKGSLTYVTGTLVQLGQKLAEAVLGRGERWTWTGPALLWLALTAGASAGAASFGWLGLRSLAIPAAAALGLAIATAPMAIESNRSSSVRK